MKGSELDIDSFGTKYRYFDIITIRAFGFYLKQAGFAVEKIHKKIIFSIFFFCSVKKTSISN